MVVVVKSRKHLKHSVEAFDRCLTQLIQCERCQPWLNTVALRNQKTYLEQISKGQIYRVKRVSLQCGKSKH